MWVEGNSLEKTSVGRALENLIELVDIENVS